MLKYKAAAGGLAALFTVYGAMQIKSDTHEPARLLKKEEVQDVLITKSGNSKATYYDFSELPSLGEDGNCQGNVGPYECWGIFDGHSGWSASTHVSNHILQYLNDAYHSSIAKSKDSFLSSIFKSSTSDTEKESTQISNEEFDLVIANAFETLDKDMIEAPLKALKSKDVAAAASTIPVALNGACAMMAFYHPLRNILKIALVGDSRTVLGVQSSNGVWHAKNLTYDQTGSSPTEIRRIRSEHPNDPPEILARGRVLGYEPSRTFGDAVTKWTREQQAILRGTFWSNNTPSLCLTPPYLTAKPVISTVELDPEKPTFMVMGCDGLFEWLSNEQVVELVGKWLEKNPVIPAKNYAGVNDQSDDGSQKAWSRPKLLKWGPLKQTVEDDNAATHLIRNALGGADFTKVSLLMSIPAPLSRRHRDDISCTVVFFHPKINSKL